MNNRPSEVYTCQCLGCSNGHLSSFEGAPPEWFIARGMTPPKNCPDCRAWFKAQYDEQIRCNTCKRVRRMPAKYKISHHKKTGPWETPTKCQPCERGKPRPPTANDLPEEEEVSEEEQEDNVEFSDIRDGVIIEPRIISTDFADYQNPVTVAGTNQKEPRWVHIMHHDPNSPHSLVDESSDGKSPSAFAGDGTFPSLVANASVQLYRADQQAMREYLEGDRIVRLTLLDSGTVEKTIIQTTNNPNGHELVTTFDNQKVKKMIKQYGRRARI